MSLKIQPLPPPSVPEADLVKGSVGLELRGDVLRLVFRRGPVAEVGLKPDGYQIIPAGHVLHPEDNRPGMVVVRQFVRHAHPHGCGFRMGGP